MAEEETPRPDIGIYTFQGFPNNYPRGIQRPPELSALTPGQGITSANNLGNPFFEDRDKVYSRDTNLVIGDIGKYVDRRVEFEVRVKNVAPNYYLLVKKDGNEVVVFKNKKGSTWNIYKRRSKADIDKALLEASENGNLKDVKYILKYGGDVKAVDSAGTSSIEHALENGYNEIVQVLVSYGATMPAYLSEVTSGGRRERRGRKTKKNRKNRKTRKSRR
jgi:hypothetical protein